MKKRHVRATPISAEDYFSKEMVIANRSKKMINSKFALPNQHEHLNNFENGGKRYNAKNNTTSKVHKKRSPRRNKLKWQQTKGNVKVQHTYTYSENLNQNETRTDHKETRQTLLLLLL